MLIVLLWGAFGWIVGGVLSVLAVIIPLYRQRTIALATPMTIAENESGPLVSALGEAALTDPSPPEETATDEDIRLYRPPGYGELARLAWLPARSQGRSARPKRLPWPIIELTTAIIFGLLAFKIDSPRPLSIFILFFGLLILISAIDIGHHIIPDILTIPATGVALITSVFTTGLAPAILGGLLIGGLFLGFHLLALLIYRSSSAFGLGDVKLAFFIGLVMGLPYVAPVILYTVIAGGVMSIGILVLRRSSRQTMPYGPNLAIGALAALLSQPLFWS